MASLEQRNGAYRVVFRYGGQKLSRSLKTRDEKAANASLARLEDNLRRVELGTLDVPPNADLAAFLLSDGKLTPKKNTPRQFTLAQLFHDFFANLPEGNLEATTLNGMRIHERHLMRHFGDRFTVQKLTLENLQQYVAKRSEEPGIRGRKVTANTINKELVTFRSVWNWAVDMGKLSGAFPRKGLRLPKATEKPPFQTWAEIEQQISRGSLTKAEEADLWDCLFLTLSEIEELLAYVKQAARHRFIYPMFVMAAHTGARRSELLRSKVNDFDEQTVIIREKKRVRGKLTTRRVPLSSQLQTVYKDWLEEHPGGNHTFCHRENVTRSKKKRPFPEPITPDEAVDHFKRTLAGSKWETIRGWHCLRHSFISNCAMRGVDQRMIDGFVGHTTEAMRRRYLHLFPNSQRAAIKLVFG